MTWRDADDRGNSGMATRAGNLCRRLDAAATWPSARRLGKPRSLPFFRPRQAFQPARMPAWSRRPKHARRLAPGLVLR